MFGWNETILYSFFIGAALKGTAVLGVAWVSAFLLRGRSAAARHLVWTAAAAAILALPFLSISLPALPVPGAAALLPAAIQPMFEATVSASRDAGARQSSTHGSLAASVEPARWRPDWKIWLMLLWTVGTAVAFAKLLLACAALWRVRRSAKRFSDYGLCGALSQALGIRHPVDVLETGTGAMPMTFGIRRAAVFMPSDAAQWNDERRRIVLLHELAHVRRGDVATHLLVRMALTLYWWNPLTWIAWREFLKERERATDDLVLNTGARASDYASHLLEVARTLQSSPAMRLAAVAMARRSQLEGRLLAILDDGVNRKTPGRASAFVSLLVALALVAPLAAVRASAQNNQKGQAQATPADVDAAIRAATSQKNYEILEDAAQTAEQVQKYDAAQKLLEAALAIRGEVSGQQSVSYGAGLVKLADLEWKRQMRNTAQVSYTSAVQIIGEQPEAAHALLYLGIAAILNKNFPQAIDLFQHAQRVDPAHAGPALMWLAVVQEREKNTDEADRLYQSALSLQDPKSSEAGTTREIYSLFLRQQGRTDEANELDARTKAIQKANAAQSTAVRFRSGFTQNATTGVPAKPANPGVYRASSPGVTPPKLLQKVEPEYSDEARAAKLQGSAMIYVEIGPDGLAHNARVLRPLGLGLDEKGLEAVAKWRFQPGTKDGQPVPVAATIEINWRLL